MPMPPAPLAADEVSILSAPLTQLDLDPLLEAAAQLDSERFLSLLDFAIT